jgi:TDG/mug DNA glycosylase family protein
MDAVAESAVPDVLAPGLAAIFCGINPGRVSAAAAAHFANPRNDFWRLLYDAGFTPRLLAPHEQFELLDHGFGVTNAAHRTTAGSGDLRRADFADSAARLARLAADLRPRAIAFVGKEAYRGVYTDRPGRGDAAGAGHEIDSRRTDLRIPPRRARPSAKGLGPQELTLGETRLFVLPSTSPANAAVPYEERLRWFRALHEWLPTI